MGLFLALILTLPLQTAHAAAWEDEAGQLLAKAPLTWEAFLQHPVQSVWHLVADACLRDTGQLLRTVKQLFGFLLCAAAVQFLGESSRWGTLLEWIFACGTFLLSEPLVMELSRNICAKSTVWKDFLFGFVPVFASSMLATGQLTGAAVCNGFFLTALSGTADVLQGCILPATQMFLAVTAAGIFSESRTAQHLSVRLGSLLRRVLGWVGAAFTALMGLQRAFSGAADRAAWHTGGTLLFSSVPIVGQALASAASGIAAGVQVVQSGLAFSALAIVGAECLPLYVQGMLLWAVFTVAGLAAAAAGLSRCEAMLTGMAAGASALAAVVALYFGMLAVGILFMLAVGGARL